MNKYMKLAIDEARFGINNNHGGPFGAVIVKNGEIIATGHNKVLLSHDPTCHGEINAIRNATEKLKTHDLKGCEIYTTGEPCPMCLCAIMWANIDKVYYGCTIKDNAIIGFRDELFESVFKGREELKDYLECIDRNECLELFNEYNNINHEIY